MSDSAVTVLIPHFQTLDAIRLCLRSIRRHTGEDVLVRVLDNGSRDDSIDYLRGLSWIECVDTGVANDINAAHYRALNVGVDSVTTPYFLVMHSDTYVHRPGWLRFLRAWIERGPYAAVGSRHPTIRVQPSRAVAHLAARSAPVLERLVRREWKPGVPWMRSCLALYRTSAFRASGARFFNPSEEDATHWANQQLVAGGHRLLALPASSLGYYVFHRGDTTRLVNAFDTAADRTRRWGIHSPMARDFYARPGVRAVLGDASLDR